MIVTMMQFDWLPAVTTAMLQVRAFLVLIVSLYYCIICDMILCRNGGLLLYYYWIHEYVYMDIYIWDMSFWIL